VVMPKVKSAMKEVSESLSGGYDFSDMTEEEIQKAAGDDEFVKRVAYEQLMEDGFWGEEGSAKGYGEKPPKSFGDMMEMMGTMAEQMREAQEKARERAEGWSEEEREAAVREYAEKMRDSGSLEDLMESKVGATIGGVGVFK
jgi:hypothetical protein